MIKPYIKKIIDILSAVSSVVLIFLMIPVLYGAVIHFSAIMKEITDFNQKMFFIAIFIAVVTVIGQWIDGRVNVLKELINLRFKNKKEVNNESRRRNG